MIHTGSAKRVTFIEEDVEVFEFSAGKVVAVGVSDHDSRMYKL